MGESCGLRMVSDTFLRTLLLTDLVGSTALVDAIGDRRSAALGVRFDRISRDLLRRHGGVEIDKTDGFLLLFERPDRAVRYALDMHRELDALSRNEGVSMRARCGIHLGEVRLRENPPDDVARGAKPLEVEGLAKPLAARVMSLAQGGQTLLTRAAFDLARRAAVGEPELEGCEWRQHGLYDLKGVSEGVEICEVGRPGQAPLTPPPSTEKAKRRGRWAFWRPLAGVLGVAAIAGTALWWSDPWGEKVGYYSKTEWHNGIIGVGPIEAPLPVGMRAYRVTTQAGRVTEVEPVGPRWPAKSVYAVHRMEQRWEGDLAVEVRALSGHGQLLFTQTMERIDANTFEFEIRRPDGTPGQPFIIPSGSAHGRLEVDERGWGVRLIDLAQHGNERFGSADTVLTRNNHGMITRIEWRDLDDNPTVGPNGQVAITRIYGDEARPWLLTGEYNLGFGDVPRNGPDGCAGRDATYDDLGRPTGWTCRDADGELTLNPNGCHQGRTRYRQDGWEQDCLDENGALAIRRSGHATGALTLDAKGQVSRFDYLGLQGEPAEAAPIASVDMTLDAFGQHVRFGPMRDVAREPVWGRDHGWGWQAGFDAQGNRESITWLGPDGNPAPGPTGHVVGHFTYDASNRPTSLRFFDAANNPILSTLPEIRLPSGMRALVMPTDAEGPFHAHVIEYHPDTGRAVREAFLDASDQPIAVGGVASRALDIDVHGMLARRVHFGVDGEPVMALEGGLGPGEEQWCYAFSWERDPAGRLRRSTCESADGQPLVNAHGFATIAHKFAISEEPMETRLEDAEGRAVVARSGFAIRRYARDASGRVSRRESFDAAGQRHAEDDGCSILEFERDAYGRKTRDCCFDVYEQPVLRADEPVHCTAWGNRDDSDTETRAYFDRDGAPTTGAEGFHRLEIRSSRNKIGLLEDFTFFDVQGRPTLNNGGYAQHHRQRDERGDVVRDAWLGIDGEPIDPDNRCATIEVDYDRQRRTKTSRYSRADGTACTTATHPPEIRFQTDSRGNVIARDHFDGRGQRTLHSGFASSRARHDHRGRAIVERFLDVDGTPIPVRGCIEWRFEHDERGHKTREACYSANGERMLGAEGFAEVRMVWSNNARATEPSRVEYRGLDDEPVIVGAGATIEREFDVRGTTISEVHLDRDGRPKSLRRSRGSSDGLWNGPQ